MLEITLLDVLFLFGLAFLVMAIAHAVLVFVVVALMLVGEFKASRK